MKKRKPPKTDRAVRDAEHGDDVEQAASASTETPVATMSEEDVDVAIEAFAAVLAAHHAGTARKPIVLLPTRGEQEQLPSSARDDAVDAASAIVDAYQARAADKPIVFWPRAFDRDSCSPSVEDDVNNAVEVVIAAHRAGKAHKPIVLGPRRGSVESAASWVKRRAAPVAAVAVIAAACLMFFLTREEQPNRAHAEVPPLPLAAETIDICPPASPAATPDVGAAVAETPTHVEPATPSIVEPALKKQAKRSSKRMTTTVPLEKLRVLVQKTGERPVLISGSVAEEDTSTATHILNLDDLGKFAHPAIEATNGSIAVSIEDLR